MHQNPRATREPSSPSARTNPSGRTNNPRRETTASSTSGADASGTTREDGRTRAGSGEAAEVARASSPTARAASPPAPVREATAKLNQIVQNYFVKAALIIAQARMICPPSYNKGTSARRVNKWFNVEIDETDIFREDWRRWKTCDVEVHRPPPMMMETYLDTANLTSSQSLVVIDDQGNRWNVLEALNAAGSATSGRSGPPNRTQVVLERWTIELGDRPANQPPDLNAILPVVYKKNIVLFRSLYTYSKFLPGWKFAKKLAKLRSNHGAFRVGCRIRSADEPDDPDRFDALTAPLFGGVTGPVTERFSFGATPSPAGPFGVSVTYRTSCEFRIDDSEEILSSHFMGLDDHFFRPSLGSATDTQQPAYLTAGAKDAVGSLPSERKGPTDRPDRTQAYGSMSTFHQVGPAAGSSPLTALRNARELGPDSASSSPPTARPLPAARSTQGSRGSVRSGESSAAVMAPPPRRPSISFQPFKSPSLSASPSPGGLMASSPRNAAGKAAGASILAQPRNRTSLEGSTPSSLRPSPALPEHDVAPVSSSPRPAAATRYTSSFGHRRGKLSSGGTSKTDDENNSSGKASPASSSAQPGSGILNEGGTATGGGNGDSSGSIKTDDDNISDFLKMLDLKKNLKSFEPAAGAASADSSSKRTSAALSKFQRMRDSNAVLSDSMSSSSLLHHRSSSSSSRQLSSVPAMVAGTSMSTSSSPGKPISPHTPHTPAIPSRLSANSVAEYSQPRRSRTDTGRRRRSSRLDRDVRGEDDDEGTVEDGAVRVQGGTTTAIDIPTSPRPFHPHNRRCSSVTQQHRALPDEDDLGVGDLLPFGIRSASMGAEDRPPLSLSALLGLQEASDESTALAPPPGAVRPDEESSSSVLHSGDASSSLPMSRQPSSSYESRDDSRATRRQPSTTGTTHGGNPALTSPYRPRIGRCSVSGGTNRGGLTPSPAAGVSSTSLNIAPSGNASDRPSPAPSTGNSRYSFSRPGAGGSHFDEDEPLLFAMSEIGSAAHGPSATSASRRSGEDVRVSESGTSGSRRGGLRRGGIAGGAWGGM